MPFDVSDHLRQMIAKRADYRCEYCLLPQSVALHKHEVDHIVPTQHGGETKESNLALSCMRCNRHKGPNVAHLIRRQASFFLFLIHVLITGLTIL